MSPRLSAGELSRRLSRHAELVCRHYLRAGSKEGRYWLVGDTSGAPGRSLYVRLTGPESGKGAAGRWTGASTLERGDLLDLIGLNRKLNSMREVMAEARAFLSLPQPETSESAQSCRQPSPRGSAEAARRLFAISRPMCGTLAEIYLRHRGLDPAIVDVSALRFHPRCYYREDGAPKRTFPALIAAATGDAGRLTGVHRTWLDPIEPGEKAPVSSPRRAMGDLLGSGVRFGTATAFETSVFIAGEGLETVMSLRMAMPRTAMIAGLSANHVAALSLPPTLRRLYIAIDPDPAGRRGMERLSRRARETGIEVLTLAPCLGDFNEDLRRLGLRALVRELRPQLVADDAARFLIAA